MLTKSCEDASDAMVVSMYLHMKTTTPASGGNGLSVPAPNYHFDTAVDCPVRIGVVGGNREILAVADRGNSLGRNTEADQLGLDRFCAPKRQLHVVVGTADIIGMTFDGNAAIRELLEEIGKLRHARLGASVVSAK